MKVVFEHNIRIQKITIMDEKDPHSIKTATKNEIKRIVYPACLQSAYLQHQKLSIPSRFHQHSESFLRLEKGKKEGKYVSTLSNISLRRIRDVFCTIMYTKIC